MSSKKTTLSAHEVAAWLRQQPTFLKQFPDLALRLIVPRDDGPTASLASYQIEVLRDKNRALSRRLAELAANAQMNEQLALRTHQLTIALMRQTSAGMTLRAMIAALAEDFAGDQLRMILLRPVPGMQAPWLDIFLPDDPRLIPFRDCLRDGTPICGRLNADKQAILYQEQAEQVQTTALLPIPQIGLVAIGSRDPNRFYPGMGTLFLRMMAESLSVALTRFDWAQIGADETCPSSA